MKTVALGVKFVLSEDIVTLIDELALSEYTVTLRELEVRQKLPSSEPEILIVSSGL